MRRSTWRFILDGIYFIGDFTIINWLLKDTAIAGSFAVAGLILNIEFRRNRDREKP